MQESLAQDDAQVKFYTGLPPYTVLMAIFKNHISSQGTEGCWSSVSLFQQFFNNCDETLAKSQ